MTSSGAELKPTPEDKKREKDRTIILEKLRRRIPDESGVGCFACRLIVEDFDLNGRLTDGPCDYNGKGTFPYLGKVAHIRLEMPALDVKVGAYVS